MMRAMTRIATAMALAVGVSVVATAPASASWTAPVALTLPGWSASDSPLVATDRQGDTMIVWTAAKDSPDGSFYQVQVRIRTAAGRLGAVRTLSPVSDVVAWPQVAVDDDGDGLVVWESEGRVVGRRVTRAGRVGPQLALSTTAALNPSVVVEPRGRALAVWSEIRGDSYVTTARYVEANSRLGPVLTLGSGWADRPAASVQRDGEVAVAWTQGAQRVVGRRLRPGRVGGLKPLTVRDGSSYGRVSLAPGAGGSAILSYLVAQSTGTGSRLAARLWNRDGTRGRVLALSPAGEDLTPFHALATDLQGDAFVVWGRRSPARSEVVGRRISRTGALGRVVRLGEGDVPAIALDDDGDGLATWQTPGPISEARSVKARKVSRSGALGALSTLTTGGRLPSTDVSPRGQAAVAWQQPSAPYRMYARFGP